MEALIVVAVHPEYPLHIHFDVAPAFRLAFFDFTGAGYRPPCDYNAESWAASVKGKGELLAAVAERALGDFDYIAVIDNDVGLRVSDINHLLFLGRLYQLDLFQPSLSLDSHTPFPHLRHRPGVVMADTTFVEVMMPFLSREIFEACRDLYGESQSGWGIDLVWSDRVRKRDGKLKVIHQVVASHLRPVQSHQWVMPNGRTAKEEMIRLMQMHGLTEYQVA